MRFQVQGYALPWDKPAFAVEGLEDGIAETCAPRAVSPDSQRNITLLYGTHDDDQRIYANTKRADRSLTFFADDYGLGFMAWLDSDIDAHYGVHRALASGQITQCSVQFVEMHRNANGRIISAKIEHVALVTEGAYADTGCWLADQPWNSLKPWLQDMRRTFASTIIERGRAYPPSQSPVTSASSHSPVEIRGRGAARPASPGSSKRKGASYAGAIMARARQLRLPLNGIPIGMSPEHLLARLNHMAAERGL